MSFKFAQPMIYRNTVSALRIIVLAMTTITLGCSSPRRASNAASEVIDVPVRFIGVSGRSMPEDEKPDKWAAVLGVVPGGIFGSARFPRPSEEAYGNARGDDDDQFRNLLCAQISKVLTLVIVRDSKSFDLSFADGSGVSISLRPEDYVGPEAVSINGDGYLLVV
jgi:hypothetical protein